VALDFSVLLSVKIQDHEFQEDSVYFAGNSGYHDPACRILQFSAVSVTQDGTSEGMRLSQIQISR